MNFAIGFQCLELTFKPIAILDVAFLFDAVSSADFPPDLALAELKDLEEARKWCEKRVVQWHEKQCFVWTCQRTCDNQALGQVTLTVKGHDLILAYWIHPTFWGKGLAVKMCQSLITHLTEFGFRGSLFAAIHAWNVRSESVLFKLGFEKMITKGQSNTDHQGEKQFQLKTMKP
ncbi:GNAT family N-acetyltransferase [Marinomonas sp. MED121]|uniref:GNAT family N-acetyltransferase n=1 Tax=Marinomonas sp. MED121 TaxID=314277 RepID=UPI0002E43DBC|nr:GNAT family N-acetyltransferase [Marinomonas sp. MED121]